MADKYFTMTFPADLTAGLFAAVGRYGLESADEVAFAAVAMWLEREGLLKSLDEMLAEGIASAEAGDLHSIEDVRAELAARFKTVAIAAE